MIRRIAVALAILLVASCGSYRGTPQAGVSMVVINRSGGPVTVYQRTEVGGERRVGTVYPGPDCIYLDAAPSVIGIRHLGEQIVWAPHGVNLNHADGWGLQVNQSGMAVYDLTAMAPYAPCTKRTHLDTERIG